MLSQRVKRERKLKKKNIDILYYVKLYLGYASFSHVLFPIISDYEKSLSNCGQFERDKLLAKLLAKCE